MIAKSLTVLTQKSKTFDWGEEQECAFQTLKDNLCNTHVLALPDGPEDFIVYCDASGLGLGCVLMRRYCQKSYADKRRKPLEVSVGDYVLLKVSPSKGVVRFEKTGKLAPRYVGPFEIIEKVGLVAYRLDLLEELDEREFKKLKRSRIAIAKVRWNSKHGPEFTWEREDQMKLKYPHLFSADSS
nr:hypothetical protein [Tanacetum cinerariifolium]